MNGFLLDTNICVFLFRNKWNIADRLNHVGFEKCFISEITLAELKYGAYKSNRTKENLQLIDSFLQKVNDKVVNKKTTDCCVLCHFSFNFARLIGHA